jgi:hypothetical protein
MYAGPIKPVVRGSLVVTVDLPVRRTVISKDVYEILDYVLKARVVSIEIDEYVLIFVRLTVAITKGVVLPLLIDILEISFLDSCPIYCTICVNSKWYMQCL